MSGDDWNDSIAGAEEIREDIQCQAFWDAVKRYVATLSPISVPIVALQSDTATLSDAYAAFMFLDEQFQVRSKFASRLSRV